MEYVWITLPLWLSFTNTELTWYNINVLFIKIQTLKDFMKYFWLVLNAPKDPCKKKSDLSLPQPPFPENNLEQIQTEVPWCRSGLRIWCSHCCGSGHCCAMGAVPGLGTSTCFRLGQNNNNNNPPPKTQENKNKTRSIQTNKCTIWRDLEPRMGTRGYLAVQATEATLVSYHIPRSLQEMWSEKSFL